MKVTQEGTVIRISQIWFFRKNKALTRKRGGEGEFPEVQKLFHAEGDEVCREKGSRDDRRIGNLHQTDEEYFLFTDHPSPSFHRPPPNHST